MLFKVIISGVYIIILYYPFSQLAENIYTRAILLQKVKRLKDGNPEEVVQIYKCSKGKPHKAKWGNFALRKKQNSKQMQKRNPI